MNILFLSLMPYRSIQERDIYTDQLRVFLRNGHRIVILSTTEKKEQVISEGNCTIYCVPTGKIEKAGFLEKGINTVLIEHRMKAAIRKHLSGIRFDLVLYPTPPITFVGAVDYVKKRDGAKTYLMLKDIFPQNALDIGIMSNTGIKGLLYRFFLKKEQKLYSVSDHIGCMSPANVSYLLKNHPELSSEKVGLCPNCIEVLDKSIDPDTRRQIREKYGIPQDALVLVYGGNLGRPQGIPFLIECLKSRKDDPHVYFLVVGDGTEYGLLEQYQKDAHQGNFRLMRQLPKDDYDTMVGACDVGMVFLDHRFTIPNFPSRILSYMQAKLPILACTDPNTDVGKVITEGGFGWWCESNSTKAFEKALQEIEGSDLKKKGSAAMEYLQKHYTAEIGYQIILSDFKRLP